jgi:hypothetical protein
MVQNKEVKLLREENKKIMSGIIALIIAVFIGLFVYPAISHTKDETLPEAPADVSVRDNEDGTYTVSWTAPTDGGSPITDYGISYTFDGRDTTIYTKSTKTFYNLDSLVKGEYLLRVFAVNAVGEGPVSENFVLQIKTDYGGGDTRIPGTIIDFSGVVSGDSVSLSWGTPLDGGSPILGYSIFYKISGSLDDPIRVDIDASKNSTGLLGLKAGIYEAVIISYNEIGDSAASEILSFEISSDGGGEGGGEESLSISTEPSVTVSSTSATITWGTSKSASSQVYYGATDSLGQMTEKMNTTPMVTGHSVVLSGLVPCTVYVYKVSSFAEDESFIESTKGEFITRGCKGDAQTIVYDKKSATAEAGATVEAKVSGRGLAAVVPAAVLDGKTIAIQAIKVEKASVVSEISKPEGKTWVGGAYILNAIEDATTEVTSFDKPVTVSIDYSNEDIGSIDPDTLRIWHYEDGAGWRQLTSCSTTVNGIGGTVTCSTTSFSVFGLFGEDSSGGGDTGGDDDTPPPTSGSSVTGSIPKPPVMPTAPSTPNATDKDYSFTKNLWVGIRDIEVRLLQQFLNLKGFTVATEGPGSPGQETDFFGNRTKEALIKFQEAYKFNILTPLGLNFGTGYFGQSTRSYINSLEN